GAGPFVQALGLALLAGLEWAARVALVDSRVPEPVGPGGWAYVPPQPAAAHGALVAAGFVAGHLLWRTPPAQAVPPPPTSLAVLLWAAVIAAMALLLLGWWRWAMARWYAGLRAGAAQDAATALAAH